MIPCISDADLLAKVERFLTKRKLAPTTFGREVMRDPRLVFDMRKGRRLGPRKQLKVLDFINASTWYG